MSKNPFDLVERFTIYYGESSPQVINRLKTNHLIIIEPQQFTKEQIADIRAAGTIVLGYLSVMESPTWNKQRTEAIQVGDYLLEGGRRVHFAQWDAYIMDLRSTQYQDLLQSEIQTHIVDLNMDGVFLDTIDDIDYQVKDPFVQAQHRQCYKNFLHKLVTRHPQLSILQNRGFDSLTAASPYLHGILWEGWRSGWQYDLWTKLRVNRLQAEQIKGLKIFSSTTTIDTIHGAEARELGFLHIDIPEGYYKLTNPSF